MIAYVKIVTPAQYLAWIAQQSRQIKAANDQVTQLRRILQASGNL